MTTPLAGPAGQINERADALLPAPSFETKMERLSEHEMLLNL